MSSPDKACLPELEAFGTRHLRSRLACALSSEPRGLAIRLEGDLDNENSQDFQKTVNGTFPEARSAGGLILDLSGLKYISSTGVGALTSLLVAARSIQMPFYLAAIPDRAKSIFDILGFSTFFEFIPGYEERR